MELLDRLKIRLEIIGSTDDLLLDELLESARNLFLSTRFQGNPYPVDDRDSVIIENRWNDWILRAAIEMYNKIGADGQAAHSENGVNRNFGNAGSVSRELMAEITPLVSIARAAT